MYNIVTQTEKESAGKPQTVLKSVVLSEKIYKEYSEGRRQTWAKDIKEDRGIMDSIQWKESDEKKNTALGKPSNSINVIRPGIRRIVGQLTANTPRFTSFGSEKSDVTTAAHVADLMSYCWYKSYGNLKFKAAVRDYEVTGIAVMMLYLDPTADFGKGELLITDLDPNDVYLDPNSKEPMTNDCAHKLIVTHYTGEQIQAKGWLTAEELKSATPSEDIEQPSNERAADLGQVQDNINDIYAKKYRVIDRYSRVMKPFFRVYDVESRSFFEKLLTEEKYIEFSAQDAFIKKSQNGLDYVVREDEVRNVQKIFDQTGGTFHLMNGEQGPQMMPGPEHEGSVPDSTTEIQKVTVGELLRNEILTVDSVMLPRIQRVFSAGRVLVTDETLPIWDWPIQTQMLYHNRNPYPFGDVRLVKPLQETLNKLNSLILTNATMATGPTVIIGTNTADAEKLEKQITKVGMKVIEVDMELPGSTPIFLYPGQLSNELYQYMASIRGDIERMIGAYSFQDGDVSNAPPTVGGTEIMDEMANRNSSDKRQDLEQMLDGLGQVFLQYMPKVYTEKKIIRLLAPNQKKEEIIFNEWDAMAGKMINDITMGEYDLRVDSGSMLPLNRVSRRQYLLDLWEKGVHHQPELILRESEISDVEDVIEKEDIQKQQAQLIEQAEGQIKELNGALQRKSAEVVHLGEALEVEKFKQDLKTASNRIESKVQLADARMNDVVKIAKANKKSSQTVN